MQGISIRFGNLVKRHPFVSAFIVALIAALIVGAIITTLIATGGWAAIPFLAVPLGAIASFLGVGSLAGAGVGASIAVGTACALGVLAVGTIIADGIVAVAVGTKKPSLQSVPQKDGRAAELRNSSEGVSSYEEFKPEPSILKFVLVGDTGVGKTKLLHRLVRRNYNDIYKETKVFDFLTEVIKVGERKMKLQIWDGPGGNFQNPFVRDPAGIILGFDLSNLRSFTKIDDLYQQVKSDSPGANFILVGCKADIPGDHKKLTADAIKWAKAHGISYIETSAKTGENVEKVYTTLAEECLGIIPRGETFLEYHQPPSSGSSITP